MKKKKIIISVVCIILFLFIIFVGLPLYRDHANNKRYMQIKSDINEELKRYMYVIAPNCEVSESGRRITEESLIYNAGMDKEKFLDVDKKSYCKATINAKCVSHNKWDWDIKISCKDYEDDGYIDWGYKMYLGY